jgi:hypothetical protein
MPAHPLDCSFERVYRADERLRDLRNMHAAIKREHNNLVVSEFQAKGWENIHGDGIQVNMSIPIGFGICMGEICYNLRTALEYLIFELAKLDSGVSQNGTQFPIEDTRKGFEWRVREDGSRASIAAISQQ